MQSGYIPTLYVKITKIFIQIDFLDIDSYFLWLFIGTIILGSLKILRPTLFIVFRILDNVVNFTNRKNKIIYVEFKGKPCMVGGTQRFFHDARCLLNESCKSL